MPKSIIDVEIDREGNLKKFVDLYEKFKASAKEAPKGMAETEKSARETAASFGEIVAAMFAQTEMLSDVLKGQEKVDKITKNTDRTFKSMARSTSEIAKGIGRTTTSLLKWASLTTVFSGLLGAGGLFGLDRLAGNVGSGRRSAQGLGTSTGDKAAFGINYGRYVDPDGLLGNVAGAKSDWSRRWAFSAAGVDPNGKDPTKLAVELITRAKSIFDKSGGSEQEAQSRGLLEFFTMDELRRLHATTKKELDASAASFGKDRGAFGLADDTSRRWQDFSVQMSRAGQTIENVFVRGLTPLIPGLTKLSDAFARGLGSFLERLSKSGAMDRAGENLSKFASYLGSDSFQNSVKTFANDVVILATKLHAALELLGWAKPTTASMGSKKALDDYNADPNSEGNFLQRFKAKLQATSPDTFPRRTGSIVRPRRGGVPVPRDAAGNFADRYLPGIAWQESRNNPNAVGPMTRYGTAKGKYQLLDSTAAHYGVDPFNPEQARSAARAEVVSLFRKYAGDSQKVLAGYNWGQGNVDRAVSKYGKDWLAHAPRETRDYIIKIENNTGGSAVVTGSQVAR